MVAALYCRLTELGGGQVARELIVWTDEPVINSQSGSYRERIEKNYSERLT